MAEMRYADQDSVLYMCNELSADDEGDAPDISLIVTLENAIADRLDDAIGRTFGVTPAAQVRTLTLGRPSPRMVFSTAVRSISAIEYGGTLTEEGWIGGTVISAADYELACRDRHGRAWAVDRMSTSWPSPVRVTAIWDDQPMPEIPDDLRDAATWLTVEEWRYRKTSPAGAEGPEGMVIRPRNPWTSETVRRTIARYRVRPLVMGL